MVCSGAAVPKVLDAVTVTSVKGSENPSDLEAYLALYPNGAFVRATVFWGVGFLRCRCRDHARDHSSAPKPCHLIIAGLQPRILHF